jgi:hypothetical protein
MKNDLLYKFLCHNICVLQQSSLELGNEKMYRPDEPKGERGVLHMVRQVWLISRKRAERIQRNVRHSIGGSFLHIHSKTSLLFLLAASSSSW